jgi:prepilin-type N-terminal cleavage/methylation domain-containing protein
MRRREGFTLVEVMVSLGVMTVGAMALIGMQQQTTRANVHARTLTVATQIAQNVIERLKLEAIAWNSVTATPATPAADLGNAPSLARIAASTPGDFMTLPPGPGARVLSNAFDYYGADLDITTGNAAALASIYYCASYRLTWVYTNYRAMRVDVRVWWTKEAPSRSINDDFPRCADDNAKLNPGGAMFDNYHVVYLSTVIRPVAL